MTSAEAQWDQAQDQRQEQHRQAQIKLRQDAYSLSRPDTTEIVANPVMTTIKMTCTVSLMGTPKRWFKPAFTCNTP